MDALGCGGEARFILRWYLDAERADGLAKHHSLVAAGLHRVTNS
jgi:hypothetical protein